jgi:dCTP deaminase
MRAKTYQQAMIFSDQDIVKAIEAGRIKIDPAPNYAKQLGSCSIDFHLSNEFKIFNHSKVPYVDLRNPNHTEMLMEEIIVANDDAFIMQPGDYVLAITKEYLEIADDLIGRIEGRSSLGRLGIIVHGTASVFDPGWRGRPVMELGNLGRLPVALYPGMRICAFTFEELKSPTNQPYYKKLNNKYGNQMTPLASRLAEEINNDSKQ